MKKRTYKTTVNGVKIESHKFNTFLALIKYAMKCQHNNKLRSDQLNFFKGA